MDQKLLNRTTRSVGTTEVGEQLFRTIEPRFAEIEAELTVLGEMRRKPIGTVRITATEHAVRTLIWPRLKPSLPKYPDIKIEISSDNRFADIVAERFDIGIRLGDEVAKDMIAVRIAPDMRLIVVGSPQYFDAHPRPTSPQDLETHDCISLRLPTHGGLLPWEFKRDHRTVNAHVKGRLVFNQSDLIMDSALAGHGVAWLPEDIVQKHVASGRLLTALDDWSITYPGYHLYYASRRSSPALSLVVEALHYRKPGRSSNLK